MDGIALGAVHGNVLVRSCRTVHLDFKALAPPAPLNIQPITSSGRTRLRLNPSAFAVFLLTTSSYFLGIITGKSSGLAPSRIRPAYWPIWRHDSGRLGP